MNEEYYYLIDDLSTTFFCMLGALFCNITMLGLFIYLTEPIDAIWFGFIMYGIFGIFGIPTFILSIVAFIMSINEILFIWKNLVN